jgi:succinyl-CoA synthetase beta subunit
LCGKQEIFAMKNGTALQAVAEEEDLMVMNSTNVNTVLSELKVMDVDDEMSNPAAVPTAVEPVIFMYSFLGGMDIERAAKGLFSSIGNVSESYIYHSQVQCTNPRAS